ncbi:hypothetical protein EV641_107175 [Rhodococcus sp. SMB37]|nr:hypothetical protein EV641_107175 [Rhodococcus sp. SMB37]
MVWCGADRRRSMSTTGNEMADAAYVTLMIAGIVMCALTLRALHGSGPHNPSPQSAGER